MLVVDQVTVLSVPTNPASAASLSKVGGLVAGYVCSSMYKLRRRYTKNLAKNSDVKVQHYGGLLKSIDSGLVNSHYRLMLGDINLSSGQ